MDPTFITGTNIEQIKKLNDDYLLEVSSPTPHPLERVGVP